MKYIDPIYGEVKAVDIIRKSSGKSKAIVIDYQTQSIIKAFKARYRELLESDDEIPEVRPIDKIAISVILNDLDEFDQNILIAYYAIADSSPTKLGRVFGVSSSVISSRVNKIIKYVHNKSTAIANNRGIHY